eukprot:11373768-Alexandrium_andersonii.AAC.1
MQHKLPLSAPVVGARVGAVAYGKLVIGTVRCRTSCPCQHQLLMRKLADGAAPVPIASTSVCATASWTSAVSRISIAIPISTVRTTSCRPSSLSGALS